jgi:hypothetical protein
MVPGGEMIQKLKNLWITFRFKTILWKGTVADLLNWIGVKPGVSTGVCGGITYGYGNLDDLGYWEYPLKVVYEDDSFEAKVRRGALMMNDKGEWE